MYKRQVRDASVEPASTGGGSGETASSDANGARASAASAAKPAAAALKKLAVPAPAALFVCFFLVVRFHLVRSIDLKRIYEQRDVFQRWEDDIVSLLWGDVETFGFFKNGFVQNADFSVRREYVRPRGKVEPHLARFLWVK